MRVEDKYVVHSKQFFYKRDQSPIIKGTKAFLEYKNSTDTDFDIPDELAPLLAGLLLTNNKSLEEAQPALEVWIKKYNELDTKIKQELNASKKSKARTALQKSDFAKVEKLLNIKTNYNNLVNTFSNTYQLNMTQTSGYQSPIIIGDQATIKYVVNHVVRYKLPEGVTVNMLKELSASKSRNKSLKREIRTKDQVMVDWIERYYDLEAQLKKTPGTIAKRALEFFNKGDLNQAMKVLEEVEGKEEIGRASYLQAQILGLQMTSENSDDNTKKVMRYFQQAISLTNDFDIHNGYVLFLIYNIGDITSATRVLNDSEEFIKNDLDRFFYKSAESLLFQMAGKIEDAERETRAALQLVDKIDYKKDYKVLLNKSTLQTQLANVLDVKANTLGPSRNNTQTAITDNSNFDAGKIRALFKEALHFDNLAFESLEKYKTEANVSEENVVAGLLVCKNNIALRSAKLYAPQKALAIYEETYEYMRENYLKNKWLATSRFIGFLHAYSVMLVNNGLPLRAEDILAEAVEASKELLDPGTISTYNFYNHSMNQYVGLLGFNNRLDQFYNSLKEWKTCINEVEEVDVNYFAFYKQSINFFLADICHRTGRYDEGIKACLELYDLYKQAPTPVYEYVMASSNSILQFSQLGYKCFSDAKRFQDGIDFMGKVDDLFDELRNVSGDFHTFIDSRKLFVETGEIGLKFLAQPEKDYEKKIKEVLTKCENSIRIDPENSILPYLSASSLLTKIRTKKQDFVSDTLQVGQAKWFFNNYIPMKFHNQFFFNLMGLENDILEHLIKRNKLKDAQYQTTFMENGISNFDNLQYEILCFSNAGESSLYGLRIMIMEAYILIAQNYQSVFKQSSSTNLKEQHRSKSCTYLKKALEKLHPEWKSARVNRFRLNINEINEECNCGLPVNKL